jgi:signal transduction histidine kinase
MSFAAQAAVAIENARLIEEAQQAKEAAQEALRLKRQFLARVSHELRSPLGAILGYAELVRDGRFGPLSAKQREIMSRIVGSTRYLADLVSDLLDQAQIEAGTIKLDAASFSLKAMVNQVMDRMNVLAQAKGLTLTTELAADAPTTLSGDEKRLQQILVNLVDNAIKFTPEGTVQVRISRPDPGHWAMQVADTGPGISPEAQAYIFDPFRQVDDPTAQRRAGVGLGLSIVRQLATMMGGEITLASEPGQGSTFTVLLPLAPLQEETT